MPLVEDLNTKSLLNEYDCGMNRGGRITWYPSKAQRSRQSGLLLLINSLTLTQWIRPPQRPNALISNKGPTSSTVQAFIISNAQGIRLSQRPNTLISNKGPTYISRRFHYEQYNRPLILSNQRNTFISNEGPMVDNYNLSIIYILIWVTCCLLKKKLRGACTDLPEHFCTAFFRTGDYSKGYVFFLSFFFDIFIYLYTISLKEDVRHEYYAR